MEKLCEINRLRAENAMLRALLRAHGIAIQGDDAARADAAAEVSEVSNRSPMVDRIALFTSLFHGRADVYARRWEGKNGRTGYGPVCGNEWRKGVCIKPKGKCGECRHAACLPFDENAVAAHLSGSCVLGVYPLLRDETCHFLAIDFDEAHWRDDVRMVADTGGAQAIPCSVEISRSGSGGEGAGAGFRDSDAGHAGAREAVLQIL